MSDKSDMSAAFYHYAAPKPIDYAEFMSLARKFLEVVTASFPGDIDVCAVGGGITNVKETSSGGTRSIARSNFYGEGIEAFPRNIWENTEMTRFIFRSSVDEHLIAMMDFQQEEVFNLTFILCPANHAIQQKMFPDWQPI